MIKGDHMMYTEDQNDGIYVERQIRVPGFAMTYEHLHDYYEIFYLKSGSCIYYLNNRHYHLSAGDLFIVLPGVSHSTSYEGLVPCERIVVYCTPDVLPEGFQNGHAELYDNLSHSGKVILVKQGKAHVEMLLNTMLEENNIPDRYSPELLQLHLMTLLLTLCRNGIFVHEQLQEGSCVSDDIEDALQYIAENFSMPLTLEDVAARINLTPTYLSRKFKQATGSTFKEYTNSIRIRQACQMLLTTDDSITKIAFNCGFNSSNYFKDCFRHINGVSPRTFRKQSKNHFFEQNGEPDETVIQP